MFKSYLLIAALSLPLLACAPDLSAQELKLVDACTAAAEAAIGSKIDKRHTLKSYQSSIITLGVGAPNDSHSSNTWVISLRAKTTSRKNSRNEITCNFLHDDDHFEFLSYSIKAKGYADLSMEATSWQGKHIPVKGKAYFAAQKVLSR